MGSVCVHEFYDVSLDRYMFACVYVCLYIYTCVCVRMYECM